MNTTAINPSVQLVDGKLTTTSRNIAEHFGKRHTNVIRAIANLDCSDKFRAPNFGAAFYTDEQGKPRQEYIITRDGFMLLAMGFTGKEAAKWKEAYIEAFNAMEQKIAAPEQAALPRWTMDEIKELLDKKGMVIVDKNQTTLPALPADTISREMRMLINRRAHQLTIEGYDRTRDTLIARVKDWQARGWSAEKITRSLEEAGGVIGDLHLVQAADLYKITKAYSMLRFFTDEVMADIHKLEASTGREWYGRTK